MATIPSDGCAAVADAEPCFEFIDYLLRTELENENGLEVGGEPEELVRAYVAKLYRRPLGHEDDFEPTEKHEVASVELQVIGLAAYEDHGFGTALSCLDDLSQDLCDVGEALLDPGDDEEGEHPRGELDFALPGGDLLYLELIEVASSLRSEQVFEVIRYLLENLLVRFGHGCFAAVYYHANWESIGLARPLRDRGFIQAPGKRNIWFADLGKARAPLSCPPA